MLGAGVSLPRPALHGAPPPAHIIAGIRAAGADLWETRVLGSIGTHESRWRLIMNLSGSSAAGYYQITAGTRRGLGVTRDELLSSPMANHRAALRLLRGHEHIEGRDAVSMFVAWYRGHVGPSLRPPWYVDVPHQAVIDAECRVYNAIRPALLSTPPALQPSPPGSTQTPSGGVATTVEPVAAHHGHPVLLAMLGAAVATATAIAVRYALGHLR